MFKCSRGFPAYQPGRSSMHLKNSLQFACGQLFSTIPRGNSFFAFLFKRDHFVSSCAFLHDSHGLSGTGMTYLNLWFLLNCQMIVFLSSPLLWELGTYFPQSQPLVKDCHFGVSPVNYSDSDYTARAKTTTTKHIIIIRCSSDVCWTFPPLGSKTRQVPYFDCFGKHLPLDNCFSN